MTALQRILDRMPDEHREPFLRLVNDAGLREDSLDLHVLALEHEARWGAVEAMRLERQRMADMLHDLPEAMRAAGGEIVRGLASDIATETTNAIKAETLPMMQTVANIMETHSNDIVAEIKSHTTGLTNAVGAEIASASSAMSEASASLAQGAAKLGGWTPQRIASVGLGIVLAAALFAAGNLIHAADVVLGCPTRVEHVTRGLHFTSHDANAVRNYICKG